MSQNLNVTKGKFEKDLENTRKAESEEEWWLKSILEKQTNMISGGK